MERFFQILAVILAGVAAYFLWNGSKDRGFITAVFAAVSFFLSIRFQVKGRLKEREIEREEAERMREEEEFEDDEFEDEETPQLNEMSANDQIRDEQPANDKEKV